MPTANEALIKKLVREEVEKQMATLAAQTIKPLTDKVDTVDKRIRSFYSNGSGGPPGALEIWREEDLARFERLEEGNKASVDNSKKFSDFIRDYAKDQERRQKWTAFAIRWGWKAALALATGALWLGSWTFHQVYPVIHAVWQEYEKNHPAVSREIESHRSQSMSEPMVSQSAHIPHL